MAEPVPSAGTGPPAEVEVVRIAPISPWQELAVPCQPVVSTQPVAVPVVPIVPLLPCQEPAALSYRAVATAWLSCLLPVLPTWNFATLLATPVQLLIPLTLVAYGCGFLHCVLQGAVAGEAPHPTWPGVQYTHLALYFTGRWLFCWLAG